MTREEAIEIIECGEISNRWGKDGEEVEKMAIKALKQELCKDAISREAVLDITWEEQSYTDAMNVLTEVRDKVKELPPVNPQKPICPSAGIDCEDCPAYEPKTGHWKRVLDKTGHLVWECTCGWQQRFYTKFCPDCGAKMTESEVQS